MCAEDVLRVVQQRAQKSKGVYETRTYVAEATLEAAGADGEKHEVPWVVGGLAYELQEDALEVVFLVVHPGHDVPATVTALLANLKKRVGPEKDPSPARGRGQRQLGGREKEKTPRRGPVSANWWAGLIDLADSAARRPQRRWPPRLGTAGGGGAPFRQEGPSWAAHISRRLKPASAARPEPTESRGPTLANDPEARIMSRELGVPLADGKVAR
jgi:hypothetical protein